MQMRRLRRDLVLIAYALLPRLLILVVALSFYGSFEQWNQLSDTPSYVAIAQSYWSGSPIGSAWDHRVFGGWPLVLLPFAGSLDLHATAVIFAVLLATIFPLLVSRLFGDDELAAVLSYFPPAWLLQSSFGMSEPLYLCAIIGGLHFFMKQQFGMSTLLISLAAITRPTAIFAGIPIAWILLRDRRWKSSLQCLVIALVIAAGYFLLNYSVFGEPLREFSRYSEVPNVDTTVLAFLGDSSPSHFGLPFVHVLTTPFRIATPAWKVLYVWTILGVVLVATVIGVRSLTQKGTDLRLILAIWALGNTLFIVSTGPYWGFHSFDRYAIWALPAYGYFLQRFSPRRPSTLLVLCAIATLLVCLAKFARGSAP